MNSFILYVDENYNINQLNRIEKLQRYILEISERSETLKSVTWTSF